MRHADFVSPWRLLATLFFATSLSLTGSACAPGDPAPKGSAATPAAAKAQEYSLRGEVRQIAADGSEITIRHEALPEFIGIDGQPEPMESMSMPFPVGDKNLLQGIAAGDKVSFRFRVDWDGKIPLAVIALEKLPAETQLDFGQAGQ